MQPIAYQVRRNSPLLSFIAPQSPDSRFRQQQRNGPPLRFRLRDETRLALAACHPMPVFDRLSPFITPEQVISFYACLVNVDVLLDPLASRYL